MHVGLKKKKNLTLLLRLFQVWAGVCLTVSFYRTPLGFKCKRMLSSPGSASHLTITYHQARNLCIITSSCTPQPVTNICKLYSLDISQICLPAFRPCHHCPSSRPHQSELLSIPAASLLPVLPFAPMDLRSYGTMSFSGFIYFIYV